MEVGDRLNPQRSYRKGFALKGLRQHIIKTNNPSTIGPGELLTVRFPDLKENHFWNHEIDFQHHSSGYRCKQDSSRKFRKEYHQEARCEARR